MEEQRTPTGAPPPATSAAIDPQLLERVETERRMTSGADWFFWIAGLSLINSIIIFSNGNIHFPVGLGITQVVDVLIKEYAATAIGMALAFDIIVAGLYVFLGASARKRKFWAFIVGMVLYGVDGLIFLALQDWLSLAFHAFALYGIFGGYKAGRLLIEMERAAAVAARQDALPEAQAAVTTPYQSALPQAEDVQQGEPAKEPAETAE